MALPVPAAAISCLLLSLLIAVTPLPGSCEERPRTAMPGSSLIQCYDDPAPARLTNASESFRRASLLPLLAELPSAAAPTGFASLRSPDALVFVRGLCFGDATVPSDCLGCLSAAARNLTSGCGATTRRAGIWTDHCFVAYADTHASSPAEDAFRSRVPDADADAPPRDYSYYLHAWTVTNKAQPVALSAAANISGPRMLATADAATPADWAMRSTVHVLAQCARDRTEADCVSCLQVSARAVDWDVDADRRVGGVAAAVLAFNCYLSFNVATELVLVPKKTGGEIPFIILEVVVVLVLALALCALCLIFPDGKKKTTPTEEEKMDAHAAPAEV